jgi:hypothetical protein
MAGLYPLSRMQQFDGNGRPLSGARLFLFDGGTSTPRVGYRDSSLTSAHPNPILADSAGRLPLIYLDDGFYRHRLTTRTGTLIFDDDGLPVLSTTSGGSGTSVDPDALFKTRDIKIRFDDQPLSGYVRLNGRTIGSALSGATERANADTQSLYEELWSFANIGVTGGKGASAAADFAANKPLLLPNMAGRGIFGMDNMGAGPQGVLTDSVLGNNPTLPGATGGAQTVTLTQGNLPSHTHPVSITSQSSGLHSHAVLGTAASDGAHTHTIADPGHNHSFAGGASSIYGNGSATAIRNEGTTGTTSSTTGIGINSGGAHTHSVSGTTSTEGTHTHLVSGNTSSTGFGDAVNKLPPLMTLMIYVRL